LPSVLLLETWPQQEPLVYRSRRLSYDVSLKKKIKETANERQKGRKKKYRRVTATKRKTGRYFEGGTIEN
jgi:hypothetical protein